MADPSVLDLLPSGETVFIHGGGNATGAEIAQRVAHRMRTLGDRSGTQIVVEPRWSLDSVVELFAVPATGAQMVLLDPRLAPEQRERRIASACSALDSEAQIIVFTSGTTGPPKGVRLTSANVIAAADASLEHLEMTRDDIWLGSLPLHHVGGLMVLYRMGRVNGGVAMSDRLDLTRGTLVSVVPTMLRRLLDGEVETGTVRAVLVGGGPLPPGMIEEADDRGIPALPTYGMTETCAQVATLKPGSPPIHAADPLPGVEIAISDVGRIMLRGLQLSPGYVGEDDRDPVEWFHTPDLGRLDEGRLVVEGRVDDVIVSGGENINPVMVEEVLAGHSGVAEVVVLGVPDREWGEKLVAFYKGEVDEGELAGYARTRLAAHEVPKRWVRLDEIPSAGPGKPDRNALRRLVRAPGSSGVSSSRRDVSSPRDDDV